MIFMIFALLVSLVYAAICTVLLLAAVPAAAFFLLVLMVRGVRRAFSQHPESRSAPRLAVLVGLVILLIASPFMLVGIWWPELPGYNRIGQTFAVIGGVVTISGWLASILAPPLSRAEFEQEMAKQIAAISALTEAVKSNTEVLKSNHKSLMARLSEGNDDHPAEADAAVQPDDDED